MSSSRISTARLEHGEDAERGAGDPLVLQAKEAVASVLKPHLGDSEFDNHGERVVRGQRMMQAATDRPAIAAGELEATEGL